MLLISHKTTTMHDVLEDAFSYLFLSFLFSIIRLAFRNYILLLGITHNFSLIVHLCTILALYASQFQIKPRSIIDGGAIFIIILADTLIALTIYKTGWGS